MACVAPSAQHWRDQVPDWGDDYLADELSRAWSRNAWVLDPGDAPRVYHDWTNFRAATLREARKRGLDLSVARLGT